ncbi:hypothetical protein EV356DRAFT_42403 [Viridothelium virens]|uniref:Uncharacterized protein n=1 Tax=Viridothelium virens TaxID=1048519 RepID=A0A6A6HGI0_VIRVR|nr:hypothetical protein EV356DRAFT_42403 [Viridothelium virens]
MNPLFTHGVIGPHSKVVELGCGVAGVVLLAIAPLVGQYIATDQQYILQHLYRNVEANVHVFQARKRSGARRKCNEADRRTSSFAVSDTDWKIRKLDWETDSAVGLSELKDASMIFAVDCIYNESLVEPFIRTCADICRFRSHQTSPTTLCVIAQQLRSEDVFETFMKSFIRTFHVWRVPERLLSEELRKPSFVVHIGILRTDGNSCIADRVYPNSILAALNER